MITGFRAILIIAMVDEKSIIARLIGIDPLVDPAHLTAADPRGIGIRLA